MIERDCFITISLNIKGVTYTFAGNDIQQTIKHAKTTYQIKKRPHENRNAENNTA